MEFIDYYKILGVPRNASQEEIQRVLAPGGVAVALSDGDASRGVTTLFRKPRPKAIDALWTMLLVPNWEHLTIECGWSTTQYIRWMQTLAQRTFVDE